MITDLEIEGHNYHNTSSLPFRKTFSLTSPSLFHPSPLLRSSLPAESLHPRFAGSEILGSMNPPRTSGPTPY